MILKDLVGRHMLDAVDFSVERLKKLDGIYDDCQVIRIRLDGVVYTIVEDPEDGYRSCMDYIIVSNDHIQNSFRPVVVVGRHRGELNGDDVLELIDEITGKLVIEVGTVDITDYYSGFIAIFFPENMIVNWRQNDFK